MTNSCCGSHHFRQVPHLVFAVLYLPPAVVYLLKNKKSLCNLGDMVMITQLTQTHTQVHNIVVSNPKKLWSTTHILSRQRDVLLVCEDHLVAEVDKPSGSSCPRTLIPVKCWCGDMRAAEDHHPEPVTWRDVYKMGTKTFNCKFVPYQLTHEKLMCVDIRSSKIMFYIGFPFHQLFTVQQVQS